MAQEDINAKFDAKIQELEERLPQVPLYDCAEETLTTVLDVLGIDNYLFHNLAMPFVGGTGGYNSASGWRGACGAIIGGCAAIGVILGGHEKMDIHDFMKPMSRAAKYAGEFEKEFGTVVCNELCGYDFSNPADVKGYLQSGKGSTTCYKYVVWAVDMVRKLTEDELKSNWEEWTEKSGESESINENQDASEE